MGFEVFDQRGTPMKGAPSVTIQKRGLISINSAAHALIDAPEVDELLCDPNRQVVAFRPAEISPRSYRLRISPSSGQTQVAAVSFLGHYRIEHPGPPPSFGPVAVRVVGFRLMGALPSVVDGCEVAER